MEGAWAWAIRSTRAWSSSATAHPKPRAASAGCCATIPPPASCATPRPVIDRVNEWFATIVGTDETRKFLNGFGGDPFINTPDAAQALFLKAIKDWGDYVRLARIVPQ